MKSNVSESEVMRAHALGVSLNSALKLKSGLKANPALRSAGIITCARTRQAFVRGWAERAAAK